MAVVSTLPTRPQTAAAVQTRSAILAATIDVIARHSLSGTTVERVAEAAGVAPGTVILHFKRKEALLIEVLEHLAKEFDEMRRAAIADAAADPVGALHALIEATFDPKVSDPAKVAVWYAFWGEAASRSVYLDRVGSIDHSYHADLVRICQDLVSRDGYAAVDAESVATGLAGLIEYLWQDIMVAGRRFDRARARQTVRAYLASVFPRHFAAGP
jgi:TetR/AcrR family transcriptional regulator, transcriptional repressor of bet genes